jgi:hypothetical protein
MPEQRLPLAKDLCIGMVNKQGQELLVLALSEPRSAGCSLVQQLATDVAGEMV